MLDTIGTSSHGVGKVQCPGEPGWFRAHAGAVGINGFTLYGFRHTFATLHLAGGTPLKIGNEWLGHSTIQQTAHTYQYVKGDVSMNYAERHAEWLRRESKAGRQSAVN